MATTPKMTQAQAAELVKAIDWNKWLAKLPQLAAIIMQLLDLLKNQPVMAAAAGACPSEPLCECLTEQQTHLLKALLHNAHMMACCEPTAPE